MAFFDPRRPSYLANPYPALAALRKQDPVHWSSDFRAWVATRYVECAEVLHDGRRFTSDPALTSGPRAEAVTAHRAAAPLGMVPHLGSTSGAEHRRIRHIVNPVFSPAAVRHAEAGIGDLVEERLDCLPACEPFDFMGAFANPLPRAVMAAVLGCPVADRDELQVALATIESVRSNPGQDPVRMAAARIAEASAAGLIQQYADGVLPAGTVLGALMPRGASSLTVEEVTSVAAQIATVGSDPTSGALGNAVIALAAHPEAAEKLRCAPSAVRAAVHEILRYDSPSHIVPRFAVIDTQLGGKRVRRGDAVLAMVGAANRDPEAFARPDDLDLERDARRELGFGQGEHICLGAPLALVVLEKSLAALLRRFAHIELAGEPEYGAAVQLRVPDRLPVVCR